MNEFDKALFAFHTDQTLNLTDAAHRLDTLIEVLEKYPNIKIDESNVCKNQTPLELFVQQRNLSVVNILCTYGADVNKQSSSTGRTALHQVAADEDVEDLDLLCLLIEWGSQLDIQDTDGCTPSVLAAQANNLYILKTLLMVGVDVNIKNREGFNLRRICCEENGDGEVNFECYQLYMEWEESQKYRDMLEDASLLLSYTDKK